MAVDFHTLGDFFPAGSAARAWLDAYKVGVHAFVDRATTAGLQAYFFVDLLVFPTAVLHAWKNATPGGSVVEWNDATRALTRVLVDETFAEFPSTTGWIVRTGETYVYDTPYHVGNSPAKAGNSSQALWADFISFLRAEVCVRHGRQLLFRAWDNWPSDAKWYTGMTDMVAPHDKLYFSIKHSPKDFVRPAGWNPTLGVGAHAQAREALA